MTHAEFKVDEWQIARFCGRAGSNIRHIQGDSKARVYVPREWSQNKSVVVVGTASQVAVATKHVKRILEGIAEEVKAKDTSEEAMAAAHRAGKAHDDEEEEPYEEWMGAYLYKR
jgi:rRNA processing protein Krr1/Pno1